MKHKYYHLTASADYLSFTFQSLSAFRIVDKKIEFVQISHKVYNLAFGDLKNEIDFDDLVVTDNKDSEQILATVVQAILVFLEVYPDCVIYFTGSTLSRTRLYRIILAREFFNWRDRFDVYGFCEQELIRFESNVEFEAFIIKLKVL